MGHFWTNQCEDNFRDIDKHSRQGIYFMPVIEAHPDKLIDVGVHVEVTEFVAVFIPFNGKFSTFCSLGQTWRHQLSWFSLQVSHHTTLSSYIAWLLAGVLWNVDFPRCIAMHALLVTVRIEVNSFLFHVKFQHIVSCYCVQVSYQVPWG